ncbi:MAG: AraC family transcriptional regulator [Chloroflexi bacterium]|nr:AraC family transcriptional regulator [Chloroflexota bacterium]
MAESNLYLQRINLVINTIRENLTDDLNLDYLAALAAFSPFHFHRIFRSIVGETLNQFVQRVRLDRATALLRSSPRMSLTDAALASGFKSLAVFSRAFKKRFGIAASRWDRHTPLRESKNGQILDGLPVYTLGTLSDIDDEGAFSVTLRELPQQCYAYIRVFDSYAASGVVQAYEDLLTWARSQGVDPLAWTLIGMSQDDPTITPLAQCSYDIGLGLTDALAKQINVVEPVSMTELPAQRIAAIHCAGDIRVVDRAWQYLFRYWLPRSRYQPANFPAMELYRRQPMELGWSDYDLDCAIPVVDLVA